MKKLNVLLYFILIILNACKNDNSELIFGQTPDERMSELQREVKRQLVEAKYGWRVFSSTLTKGDYGHYMDFDANGEKDRLRMVSDINSITSSVVRTSAYRVKLLNAPMLSFETYNYIHELADPNPDVIAGEVGKGLQADIEFELKRTTADSLFFTGRKFRSELILVRATKEEQEVYLSGGFKDVINEVKSIFLNNQISLFDYKGTTYQMTINSDSRTLAIAHLENETIKTSFDLYSSISNGVQISKPMSLGDDLAVNVLLENHKLYMVTQKGEKLEIRGTTTPFIPLNKLMGTMYTKLFQPFRTQYPGTNAAGATILYQSSNSIPDPIRPGFASKADVQLVWDAVKKHIYLQDLHYYSANPSISYYRYNYSFDEATGLFKLSNEVNGGGSNLSLISQLRTFLKSNEFKVEYYFDNGNAYGQIISKDGKTIMTMMPLSDK